MKKFIILILFFGFELHAEIKVEQISAPLGGMNTHDPSFRLLSQFSPYMRNVFIDNGRIEGINGFTVLGSSMVLSKVTGIFPFVRETGAVTFLVTDSSMTLETSDFTSWTFVSSASNSGGLLNWLQVKNKMWGFNGLDFVITWDGTTKKILNGTNNTPNPPKFKYGAFWQERVWGFSNPNGISDLDFSSIVTTDAVIINPDDSRAWPTTNNLKIGSGDGEFGTAIWIKNGQLKIGKERSKYTIYGTNVSNYFARKDASNSVGVVSNESVVNMDDATYYLSADGIYKDEERISDLIQPDVDAMNKGITRNLLNVWESKTDFERGQFFGTTATVAGLLTENTKDPGTAAGYTDAKKPFTLPTGVLGQVDAGFTLQPGTTFFGPVQLEFSRTLVASPAEIASHSLDSTTILIPDAIFWANSYSGASCNLVFASVTIQNNKTGTTKTAVCNFDNNISRVRAFFSTNSASPPIFDALDILNSSLSVKVEGCGWTLGNFKDNAEIHFIHSTTAQYISDIATLTSVTAWGNFDSVNSPNLGSMVFYTRTSTSVVNIATRTWTQTAPGSILSFATQENYIQWASTFFSVSSFTSVPNIDNVSISHIEGASSINRAFAINWKNRYWLATSTAGDTLSLLYVKSIITNPQPNAWMPIEGINIRCLAKYNDVLYAGSSSTGSVLRLDFGTNFNGSAIPFIYDTPDMILGSNYTSKDIQSYLLDADKDSGLTLTVGSSIDKGTFSNKSVSMDGSGRKLYVVKGVTNPCKTLRVRLSHSLLDKRFSVNDLSILYSPTAIIEPK